MRTGYRARDERKMLDFQLLSVDQTIADEDHNKLALISPRGVAIFS